ncbi:phage major capsid protein [Streptomyces sp. 4N124]|uniref:phage major capsid protein n=1 Tax=Streptomyces sp. 4N124 TaxID=3457420 RepID=UPI003FD58A0E
MPRTRKRRDSSGDIDQFHFQDIHEARAELAELAARYGDAEEIPEGTQDHDRWEAAETFVTRAQERVEELRELAARPGCTEGVPCRTRPRDNRPGSSREYSAAMRVIERHRADELSDASREKITAAFDLARSQPDGAETRRLAEWVTVTGDPDYLTATAKLFSDPEYGHREWTREEYEAFMRAKNYQRAVGVYGTGAAGAFLAPFQLNPAILLTNDSTVNPIRQLARVEVITSTEWHGITSAGTSAHWTPELQETTESTVSLLQPPVPTHKRDTWIVSSIEASQSTNISQQVKDLALDAFNRLESTAFTLGSGTNEPTGIITALDGSASQVFGGASIDRADVIAFQESLAPRWRPAAKFMAALEFINELREFGLMANSVETSLVVEGTPYPKLRGWDLVENSEMDKDSSVPGANVLVVGDFSNYLIADSSNSVYEFVPHVFGSNGRPLGARGWYSFGRTGGDVIAPGFKLLSAGTS